MRPVPSNTDYDGWVRQLSLSYRRQDAKRHLRNSGRDAVPALRRGLQDSNAMVRRLCASVLDQLADQDSFVDLIAALDDPDAGVRRRALHALACDQCKQDECRPDDDMFVPRAIELLRHRDPDVRAAAIDALGKVQRRRADAGAALAEAVTSEPDPRLRAMARSRTRRH